MRERRAKEKAKKEAENERKRLQRMKVKAAKDLKANAAQNTTDLIIP